MRKNIIYISRSVDLIVYYSDKAQYFLKREFSFSYKRHASNTKATNLTDKI